MPLRYYANAPATTLSAPATSTASSISIVSTSGLPIQYPYTLIIDRGLSTEEVVSVTAASGLNLTVTRGEDSTAAFAHALGAAVVHGISAQDIRESNSHVNATSNVHGVSAFGTAATVNTGTASGNVPLLSTGGVLPIARIATGSYTGTEFVRGDGQLAVPASGAVGAMLTRAVYKPGTFTTLTTTSQTSVDVDATNLVVTFTATTTAVDVVVDLLLAVTGTAGYINLTIRSGASDVSGTETSVIYNLVASRVRTSIRIAGLTAGTSYTYKLGWRVENAGSTGNLYVGGAKGAATMEVYAR